MSRIRKPLAHCANHPGRKPDPPSLVLCRECQDGITAKMEEMLADMQRRAPRSAIGPGLIGDPAAPGDMP